MNKTLCKRIVTFIIALFLCVHVPFCYANLDRNASLNVTTNSSNIAFREIECFLNPLNWDGRGQQSAIAYRRSEGEKQARKGSAPRVAVTQAQRKFPGMTSEMRSHHNEILNHSPKSPA